MAKWATTNDEPPSSPYLYPNPFDVYRLVHVTVEMVGKGDIPVGEILPVRIPGGTIGCLTFTIEGWPAFRAGDQVALFFGTSAPLAALPPSAWDVIDAWPTSRGMVQLPNGTTLTVDQFVNELRSLAP